MKNQSGGAVLIITLVLTFSSILLLGLLFNYIVTRAKYHGRIRDAYQISNVMEDFAKTTRQAYDTAASTVGANCPDGKPKTNTVGMSGGLQLCFPPCPNPPIAGAPGCDPTIGDLCIMNLGQYYCMMPDLNPVVQNENSKRRFYVQRIPSKEKPFSGWLSRLEAFYKRQFDQLESSKNYSWVVKNLNYDFDKINFYANRMVEKAYAMSIMDAISICLGGGPAAATACGYLNGTVQACIASPTMMGCSDLRGRCTSGGPLANLVPNCSLFPQPSPTPSPVPSPPPTPTATPSPPESPPSECFAPPVNKEDLARWRFTCSGYCDQHPGLPVCQDLPQIGEYDILVCPAPPAPQPSFCQGCGANENCLEMGYCLEAPCGTLGGGYIFKEIIKLIVN